MKYYSEETVKKIIAHAEYNGTFCIQEPIHLGTYSSIELPDKHGDLKDEMDIIHRIEKITDDDLAQDIIGEILASPTIVEASK